MAIGVFYYILILIILAITWNEKMLDNSASKVLLYSIIIISILSSISLGYFDKNSSYKVNKAIIYFEDKTLEGTIIGTSKNYIFFRDSTDYVLNRDRINSIKYLPSK